MNPASPAARSDRLSVAHRFARTIEPASSEELADALADDREADHARALVDLADRLGRNQTSAAEEPGADGQGIGDVGLSAVHRGLDVADVATLGVGDHESLH